MILSLLFLIASVAFVGIYMLVCMTLTSKSGNKQVTEARYSTPVSIIVACHNEEKHISQRLKFFLHESEWIEGSEIIVVSTGCTDNTNEIIRGFKSSDKLRALMINERWSKIKAVNHAVGLAKNDVLIFSDCRQSVKEHSVKKLVHHFAKPSVGVVASMLCESANHCRQSIVRRLMNYICLCHSKAGYAVNIHGALYAQRKSCFKRIPEDILFDDLFVIASCSAQRKQIVMEPEAIIYDLKFEEYYYGERIERLARGLLLFVTRYWRLIRLMPIEHRIAFLFYKYSKLLMPLWFIAAITTVAIDLAHSRNPLEIIMTAVYLCSALFALRLMKLVSHVMVFSFHFFCSTFKFFLMHERGVHWEKLKFN